MVPIREAIHHTTVKALGHLYWNIVNNMELPKFMQFMEHSQKPCQSLKGARTVAS
jgi:hypothetical protein